MEIVATRRVFQLPAMFALIGHTFWGPGCATKRMKPIQIEQLQLRKNLSRHCHFFSIFFGHINQGNVRNLP